VLFRSLIATGRKPHTKRVGLEELGVKLSPSGKVIGAAPAGPLSETSSLPSIHALGDCLEGKPELTPVAIHAGKLLARRLVMGSGPAMDYSKVPTCVFTPMEYACVGMSEEAAIAQYGEESVEVYHLRYDTLENGVAHRSNVDGSDAQAPCYSKVVCVRATVDPREPVLGLHIFGPQAGDVIQGFAVAMKLGMTMETLRSAVGLHPTHAEEVLSLDRSKRSGVKAVKTSC